MKYKGIKKILKGQIENNVKALWTFDKETKSFTMIYKNYSNELKIYTPQQLLDEISLQEV
jgi:hypothetical protein